MLRRTVLLVLAVALLASVAAAETCVRRVQFTANMNWSGLVLLEMPESFIAGASGVYVSSDAGCQSILPTFWAVVGKNAYVVFDPGKSLTANTSYTFYLCYGDMVIENHLELASCDLPDNGCSIANVTVNATFKPDGLYVNLTPDKKTDTFTFSGWNQTEYNKSISIASDYATSARITLHTMVRQNYTFTITDSGGSEKTQTVPASSYDSRDTVEYTTDSFDTGLDYYDTGNYTVYDAGSYVYVENGYLSATIYDSDWDTYYVYVYVDNELVAEYYEAMNVFVNLSGRWLRKIVIRVYDTERNDYVRASGEVHVEIYNYTYTADIALGKDTQQPYTVKVSAQNMFDAHVEAAITYYMKTLQQGWAELNTTQYLVIVYGASGNATTYAVGSSYASSGYDTEEPLAWSIAGTDQDLAAEPVSRADLAASPDAASLSAPVEGIVLGAVAPTYPDSASNATIEARVYGSEPGTYVYTWKRLLVFEALSNYTDYFIGAEETVQSGGGGGQATGNGTIQITVYTESKIDPTIKTLILMFSIALPFVGGLFAFYKAVSTDQNIWIAVMLALFSLSSTAAFAAGYYDAARGLLAVNLLALYPIVERAMDYVYHALFRRRKR